MQLYVPEEIVEEKLPRLYVPEEIVKEILQRLPVKCLSRFNCVSKIWNSIISDLLDYRRVRVVNFMKRSSQFLCFHFMDYEGVFKEYLWRKKPGTEEEAKFYWTLPMGEDSEEDDPHGCRCFRCSTRKVDKSDDDYGDYYVDGETSIRRYQWGNETSQSEDDEYEYRPHYCFLEGSCDGLLLVVVKKSFFLWNPATRDMKKVLELGCLADLDFRIVTGLCYDSSTDDYKVVVGLAHRESPDFGGTFVIVASLKEKQWRRVQFPHQVSSIETGPVVNGFLHWTCKKRRGRYDYDGFYAPHKIVAFDPTTDKFKELPMPDTNPWSDGYVVLGLGVLGGCLCMTFWENDGDFEGNVEIIVMKEYVVKESWTTMFEISNVGIQSPFYTSLRPLLLMKNGEILLKMDRVLLMYNPRKMTHRRLNAKSWSDDGNILIESLVSPTRYEWVKEKHQRLGKKINYKTADSEGIEDYSNGEEEESDEDSNAEAIEDLDSKYFEFFSLQDRLEGIQDLR